MIVSKIGVYIHVKGWSGQDTMNEVCNRPMKLSMRICLIVTGKLEYGIPHVIIHISESA